MANGAQHWQQLGVECPSWIPFHHWCEAKPISLRCAKGPFFLCNYLVIFRNFSSNGYCSRCKPVLPHAIVRGNIPGIHPSGHTSSHPASLHPADMTSKAFEFGHRISIIGSVAGFGGFHRPLWATVHPSRSCTTFGPWPLHAPNWICMQLLCDTLGVLMVRRSGLASYALVCFGWTTTTLLQW